MTVRTWQLEVFVVASIVFGVALFVGRGAVELVGAGAVVLSFAHGQVSDRLAEDAAVRDVVTVDCYRWSTRYFVAKEVLWVVYFVVLGAWSALAGCALFLVYPFWRRWWRRRNPRPRETIIVIRTTPDVIDKIRRNPQTGFSIGGIARSRDEDES